MARTRKPTDFTPDEAADADVAPRGAGWRNRIIGAGKEVPANLLANPRNARIHPKTQQDALKGVLESVGVVQQVIVNQRTGFLVDGHLRVALALREGVPYLPVSYVDLSPEEEDLVLATFDPITALAGYDSDKLGDLLASVRSAGAMEQIVVPQEADDMIAKLLEKTRKDAMKGSGRDDDESQEDEGDHRDTQLTGHVWGLQQDVRFPSDNVWGIPALVIDRLSKQVPRGVWDGVQEVQAGDDLIFIWGTSKPTPSAMNSNQILAFFTDDYRFEVIWNDAVRIVSKLMAFQWGSVVAPDFSVHAFDAAAVQLWQHYRSMWVARYWQEVGIDVIPNLPYITEKGTPPDWFFGGFPVGAPVVATQVRTSKAKGEKLQAGHQIAASIERTKPQVLYIYGGEENREWLEPILPVGTEYVWGTAWTNQRRKKRVVQVNRKGGQALMPEAPEAPAGAAAGSTNE